MSHNSAQIPKNSGLYLRVGFNSNTQKGFWSSRSFSLYCWHCSFTSRQPKLLWYRGQIEKYLNIDTRKNIAFYFTPCLHQGKDGHPSLLGVNTIQESPSQLLGCSKSWKICYFLSHLWELKMRQKGQQKQNLAAQTRSICLAHPWAHP